MSNVDVVAFNSSLLLDTSSQSGTGTILVSNAYLAGNSGNNGAGIISSNGARSMTAFVSNAYHTQDANAHAFQVSGGTGKTFNYQITNIRSSNKIFNFGGATSHTVNVMMQGVISDNFTPASGNMMHSFGTTCTWNFLGNCLDIGVDLSSIARQSGTLIFNTNAALGTLGAAGPVVGHGTAANSWRLMGDPTKQY
jgi:hypothetical protein